MFRRPICNYEFQINDLVVLNNYGIECSKHNNKHMKKRDVGKIIDVVSTENHNKIYEILVNDKISELMFDYCLQPYKHNFILSQKSLKDQCVNI